MFNPAAAYEIRAVFYCPEEPGVMGIQSFTPDEIVGGSGVFVEEYDRCVGWGIYIRDGMQPPGTTLIHVADYTNFPSALSALIDLVNSDGMFNKGGVPK